MKTIKLKDNEAELLLLLLKDIKEIRDNMSCNDPEKKEENLFSEKERKEMLRFIGIDEEDYDIMFNSDYPEYLKKLIKKQLK